MSKVECYTDGSCKNNKNSKKISIDGGSGGIILCSEYKLKFMKKIKNATNNIAELNAILECVKILDKNNQHKEKITIHTDSMYSLNCLTKWYKNWEKNGWKAANGKPVSNVELIKEILEILKKFNDITFKYIKAHANNKYNDYADEYANKGGELENYEVYIEEFSE